MDLVFEVQGVGVSVKGISLKSFVSKSEKTTLTAIALRSNFWIISYSTANQANRCEKNIGESFFSLLFTAVPQTGHEGLSPDFSRKEAQENAKKEDGLGFSVCAGGFKWLAQSGRLAMGQGL
ncbi:MAG: hypothetical protein WCL19_08650, partial [Verrucomicrobiota bacterium]